MAQTHDHITRSIFANAQPALAIDIPGLVTVTSQWGSCQLHRGGHNVFPAPQPLTLGLLLPFSTYFHGKTSHLAGLISTPSATPGSLLAKPGGVIQSPVGQECQKQPCGSREIRARKSAQQRRPANAYFDARDRKRANRGSKVSANAAERSVHAPGYTQVTGGPRNGFSRCLSSPGAMAAIRACQRAARVARVLHMRASKASSTSSGYRQKV